MKKNIKNNVSWLGKTDWELRKFHGNEYSTQKGSSYNSYLIQEEKNVLIDTVWAPFAKEFVDNLKSEIDLTKIDYIVANHGEVDHSGALPELMRYIPNTPIYCTANAVKSLKGQYHQDWNFHVVKTGDRLPVGNGKELIFIEAPMLHWPDSMFCYLTGDEILFSNDAFGQHFASESLYNDSVIDQHDLFYECMKYYANILAPFSGFVTKKIQEIVSLGFPLSIICPSHGIVWRDNPMQIVEKYLEWANNYQQNQITIVYDTMWNGTRIMAESLAHGIAQADQAITVKVFNAANTDKNDLITEIFKSKALLIGSPTINNGISTSIAALLEELHGLKLKNKKAASFGCYGWSGEAIKLITARLKESGFDVIGDGLKILWKPDEKAIEQCIQGGIALVIAC